MLETDVKVYEAQELQRRERIKAAMKEIRFNSDPKLTRYQHSKKYGHNFSEAYYLSKDGGWSARVFRTNRQIDHIMINGETVIFQ